jgi:pimeloyl-ACP methyl ester carboxylesterase
MKIVDRGKGVPIVVVPGIQGRWEWMSPAIEALAARCRVITFSLADEPSCGGRFDPATGFACYVAQVGAALDLAGLERAAICGVSYGGLIAAAFAARHSERTAALVLVSALPPTWQPDGRIRFYRRAPRLLSPLFMLASLRMYKEIAAATSGRLGGTRAALGHGRNVLRHLFSPTRMAARVDRLGDKRLIAELRAVQVPTLVVTGEAELDRVVPVHRTREYLAMWPHAVGATIARTGHLGLITRPDAFADVVVPFVERHGLGSSADRGMAAEPDTQVVRRRIV